MTPKAPKPAASRGISAVDDGSTALPTVDSIGITRAGKGWVVVMVSTKGDKVVGKTVLSVDPEPKSYAAMRAQNEIAKHFVAGKAGEA